MSQISGAELDVLARKRLGAPVDPLGADSEVISVRVNVREDIEGRIGRAFRRIVEMR